jgi:cystathionine beta-lyase/cystathionine gamma-synthase
MPFRTDVYIESFIDTFREKETGSSETIMSTTTRPLQNVTAMMHAGDGIAPDAKPLTTPIYETTTFVFDSAAEVEQYQLGKSSKFLYSRYANPTIQAAEQKIAALERGEAALIFGAGMAATATTVMALTKAGDEVVCSAAIYGGTLHLLHDVLERFGVTTRFLSLEEMRHPDKVMSNRTRLFWFESPINPTLRCLDIAAVAAACRARGVVSCIDSTFASPINQQPLALGVDLVMHSATKYLGGHSDITAGTVIGSQALIEKVDGVRRMIGTVLDPYAAYALNRSLKTVHVRVARQNENALAIAQFLADDKRVAHVYYPGLPGHPDHAIAKAQMSGFGGMVCIDLGDKYEPAARAFDRFKVIQRAASLGGVESIASLPVLTSQWGYTPDQLMDAGITRGMIRLSVGLEDVKDLIADLDQALG